MTGLTYDTGALIAAEARRRTVWVRHQRALERGVRPVVPAGVLGQAWRAGPQAELSRFLKGCRVEDLDAGRAKEAGAACGRSSTSDLIDATVVVGAIARGDAIVTSDPKDMQRIASGLNARIEVAAP